MVYCYPDAIRYKDLNHECTYTPMRLLMIGTFNTSEMAFHGDSELMLNLTLNESIVKNITLTYNATTADVSTQRRQPD